jgi:hypothetical protein
MGADVVGEYFALFSDRTPRGTVDQIARARAGVGRNPYDDAT